jgi:hypothetical protein
MMSNQFETGESIPHQTTWQDIARGYRQILVEKVIPALVQVHGEKNLTSLATAMEAIDTEADLLVAKQEAPETTIEERWQRWQREHNKVRDEK